MRTILVQALFVAPLLLTGQDQMETVPVSLTKTCTAQVSGESELRQAEAPKLVVEALGKLDPDTYYMIHVAKLGATKEVISSQHWYTYSQSFDSSGRHRWMEGGWNSDYYNELRIFGARKVGLIYLHIVDSVSVTAARNQLADRLKVTDLTSEEQGKLKAASDLVNGVSSQEVILVSSEGGGELERSGDFFRLKGANITHYKIAIKKKIPAPLANLADIAAIAMAGEGEVSLRTQPTSFCGGEVFEVRHVPSDLLVSTLQEKARGEATELAKNTYDNEGRYWFDFSLALPLRSYKDLTVDQTNNTFTAKAVEKQRLLAMFNFSPFGPHDTKKAHLQLLPIVLVGLPIAGKPLQHPVLAAGVGVNKVQFFVGWQFNRKRELIGGASTAEVDSAAVNAAGPARTTWGTQMIYGINFTVSAVKDLLRKGDK